MRSRSIRNQKRPYKQSELRSDRRSTHRGVRTADGGDTPDVDVQSQPEANQTDAEVLEMWLEQRRSQLGVRLVWSLDPNQVAGDFNVVD